MKIPKPFEMNRIIKDNRKQQINTIIEQIIYLMSNSIHKLVLYTIKESDIPIIEDVVKKLKKNGYHTDLDLDINILEIKWE